MSLRMRTYFNFFYHWINQYNQCALIKEKLHKNPHNTSKMKHLSKKIFYFIHIYFKNY